jgi:glutathione S-transferase
MHAGFAPLRRHCPMNVEAALADVGQRLWAEQADLRDDVARIERMWTQQLSSSGGPMLFGEFSAADAYFAPVMSRLQTYALPVGDTVRAYMRRVDTLHAVREWQAAACAEHDFLDFEEPYRGGAPTGPA